MKTFPDLADLVPHSGRMILLDRVTEASETSTVCSVVIREGALFLEDGKVPAIIAIEYMAQAIGAHVGLGLIASGKPIQIGYLLGTREMTLESDGFEVGDELSVEVKHVWGDDEIGVFECAVSQRGRQVVSATLKVYRGAGQ